jgi:hypothetical protein
MMKKTLIKSTSQKFMLSDEKSPPSGFRGNAQQHSPLLDSQIKPMKKSKSARSLFLQAE